MVIRIFSWGLRCQCPCPHSEPRPAPTSPGGPPVSQGRCLDLLWARWGPLRLWRGPTPTCTCPQSPLLLRLDETWLWEHSLSCQIFHGCRLYQADLGDLTHGVCSCKERSPPSLFFSRTAPGAQLRFWPHLCMRATPRRLFRAQARGNTSCGWLGHTTSSGRGGVRRPQGGVCELLQWRGLSGSCDRLGRTRSCGCPSQCPRRQGLACGEVAALPLVQHSTMAPHFLGRPHFP